MKNTAKVLVIEDDEGMCDSCCRVLTKEGYETEATLNGETGLSRVKEILPDLVLVDLKMPGISGIEVLKRIKQIDPNIITVVITGYATVESAVESMKCGAYDFLPKPFTPDTLRIIIRRGLEKRKLVLESILLKEEKRKMEELFISMVTHELRSPITAVHQYMETILHGFTGRVDEKQKEMIERSKNRLEIMLKLITDWLNMAQIDPAKLVSKFELIDISSIIKETVEFFQPQAQGNNISVSVDIPDRLPLVKGDKEILKIVFNNLLNNAIKFNINRGKVEIRVKAEEGSLLIEFTDTGKGIPIESIPFIFDPFYRVKGKETVSTGGSGLGLTISKKIIDIHSGIIKVSTEMNKGSTFTVILPVYRR